MVAFGTGRMALCSALQGVYIIIIIIIIIIISVIDALNVKKR